MGMEPNLRRKIRNGEHAEFSAGEERKQRIVRLGLSNEMRRSKLEVLRQNTVTVGECEKAMNRLRAAVGVEREALLNTTCLKVPA